jgi:dihydroorotase
MAERTLLRGARLVDPASDRDEVTDVLVEDARVSALGASASAGSAEIIDCEGLVLAPGLVDVHTHLREPGREDKETVETGSRAAAMGGYTAITAMANTEPVADDSAVVREVIALAERAGLCFVVPVGAITRGLEGEAMAELGEMVEAGVRMFSDDGHCVPEARTLRNALQYVKAFDDVVIAEHCEDGSLAQGAQMHEGLASYSLGLTGEPREAEEVVVARDLAIARLTGGRLHLMHLSSAGSVQMVRAAKAEGIRVTAEVTPHHLVFIDQDLAGYDTNLKVKPPLRGAEDREALREALADGAIDAVATDHAPHAVEEKEAEFDHAPPGTIGLETALSVVLTELVAPGLLSLPRAIEAMSPAPARILGLAGHGGPIAPGAPANLVAFDPAAAWVVEAPFASKSRNSAFLGRELTGRVVHTMFEGSFTVLDGKPTR